MIREDVQIWNIYLLGESVNNSQEVDLFFAVICETE